VNAGEWEADEVETGFNVKYRRLPCGHYRKVNTLDPDADGPGSEEESGDFCFYGCHADA
jgi:hypothetical protein